MGCGTTKSILPSSSTTQTTAPAIVKIEIVSNLAGTPDVIRSAPGTTMAVEPNSVIKIYNSMGAVTTYSTIADNLGRFSLNIGDNVLDPVILTATAPFKGESSQRGFGNPSSPAMQTTAPTVTKIELIANPSGTTDVIRSVSSTTFAVEPNSLIKIYDGMGFLTGYSTTADSMGNFNLNIGDNSVVEPVFLTATAPSKSESSQRGFANPF